MRAPGGQQALLVPNQANQKAADDQLKGSTRTSGWRHGDIGTGRFRRSGVFHSLKRSRAFISLGPVRAGARPQRSCMEDLAQPLLDVIRVHSDWAGVVMFVTAFAESFAFLSLLFPGTTVLIAAGTLMSAGTLPYAPVLIGAILGAVLGDSVSYWIGRRFGSGIAGLWPFSRNPDLLPSGIRFFERHGGKSVFIGRFFGPIRAVIPLAAGIMRMPRGRFWFANVTSAIVWAPMLLLVGDAVGEAGGRLIGSANTVLLVFGGLTLFGLVAVIWAALRSARPKA